MIISLPIKKYIVKTYLNNTNVSIPIFVNQVMQYLDDNFLTDEIICVKDTFGIVKQQIGKFCYLVYVYEDSNNDSNNDVNNNCNNDSNNESNNDTHLIYNDDNNRGNAMHTSKNIETEQKKSLKEIKVHKNDMRREVRITKNLINAYFISITINSPFGKIIQPKLVNDIKKQEEEHKKNIYNDLLRKKEEKHQAKIDKNKKNVNEIFREFIKEKSKNVQTKTAINEHKKTGNSIEGYLNDLVNKEINNDGYKVLHKRLNGMDELDGHKNAKINLKGTLIKKDKATHNGKKIKLEQINEKYNIILFDVFVFASTFSNYLGLEMCDFSEFASEIVKFKKSKVLVEMICKFIKIIAHEKRKSNNIEDFKEKIRDAINNVIECYIEDETELKSDKKIKDYLSQPNIMNHTCFWSISAPTNENYEGYIHNFLKDCFFIHKIEEVSRFFALFVDKNIEKESIDERNIKDDTQNNNENNLIYSNQNNNQNNNTISNLHTLLTFIRFMIKIVEQTVSFRSYIDKLVDTIKVKEKEKYDLSVKLRPRKKDESEENNDINRITKEHNEIERYILRNRYRTYFGCFNKALYYFVNDTVYFIYEKELFVLESALYDSILKKGKLYNSRDTYLFVTTLRMIKNVIQKK
ncbi:hypothetical protein BDAP_002108 [Binucleata daphniae]